MLLLTPWGPGALGPEVVVIGLPHHRVGKYFGKLPENFKNTLIIS